MHRRGTNSSAFNKKREVQTAQCSLPELNGWWMGLSWGLASQRQLALVHVKANLLAR